MEKVYTYKNATICIRKADAYNRRNVEKATEEFLKKVISGGNNNGNSNTSRNFREK